MKHIILLFIFSAGLAHAEAFSQSFINGDFELNSAVDCDYNNTDIELNETISNVFAFGMGFTNTNQYAGEVDLHTSECYVEPQNGNWCLGLSSDVGHPTSDAIAIELTSSLVPGQTYELVFHIYGNQEFSQSVLTVEVGESMNPDEFGELIDSDTPNPGTWKEVIFVFTAVQASNYISVRTEIGSDGWTQVDNFSISQGALSLEENGLSSALILSPNPASTYVNIDFNEYISSGFLMIRDLTGKVIRRQAISARQQAKLDVSILPAGVYFVELESENTSGVTRFIKE